MANYGEEAADLAKLGGALVINMGTVTPEGLENYKKALRAYNAAVRPVVFDPVGYVQPILVADLKSPATLPLLTYMSTTAPGQRQSAVPPSRRYSPPATST